MKQRFGSGVLLQMQEETTGDDDFFNGLRFVAIELFQDELAQSWEKSFWRAFRCRNVEYTSRHQPEKRHFVTACVPPSHAVDNQRKSGNTYWKFMKIFDKIWAEFKDKMNDFDEMLVMFDRKAVSLFKLFEQLKMKN